MSSKIERYILLAYDGINHEFHNCEGSDDKAILDAIRSLEFRLGKMRGGLKRYFKENPENIVVKFWG